MLATPHPVKVSRSVDMQYAGQLFEISVDLPDEPLTDPYLTIRRLFEDSYKERYGFAYDDIEVELINVRVIGHEIGAELLVREWDVRQAGAALKGRREAFCHELGRFVTHDVYDRYALAPGTTFSGPAIVEERESTCIVGPAGSVSVDRYGSLVVTW